MLGQFVSASLRNLLAVLPVVSLTLCLISSATTPSKHTMMVCSYSSDRNATRQYGLSLLQSCADQKLEVTNWFR